MKKHKIVSKIFLIALSFFVIDFIIGSVVFGQITPGIENANKTLLEQAIGDLLGVALGALGSALSMVVLLIVGVLFIIIWLVFYPITGQIPAADNIVFNGIAFFDPNFMNPANGSIAGIMRSTIQQVYVTGYIVAGSVFVIGAMIIGMKLAISSIASEKAYYKEMIVTWLKGLLLLFVVHILVAGVFYLNEMIVSNLYEKLAIKDLSFETTRFSNDLVGKTLNSIVKGMDWIASKVTGTEQDTTKISGNGIGGLILILMYNGVVKGDLISAIAVGFLLGQTISLCILYIKRTIVCVALGALAPYIVAVDFIKKLV